MFIIFPPIDKQLIASIAVISIDSSLTNRRKTEVFDNFWLVWAIFLGICSLVLRIDGMYSIQFIQDLNPSKYVPFRFLLSSFDAWFTQNKFLTELDSPNSEAHFSFATYFHYLNLIPSNFIHISNIGFPLNVVYNVENRLLRSFFSFEK